jgi:hypothetical protein
MKRNVGEQVSGKIGNVVFYQRYGKDYVRSAPMKKRETWTEEQLLYRQRLKKASALWKALKSDDFPKIWNKAAVAMNGYAWFMKSALTALEMDGTMIDILKLKVSDGKLPVPQDLQAERMPDNANIVSVSWKNDSHSPVERLKDELMIITHANGKFSDITASGLKRRDLKGQFALPERPEDPGNFYLFMASENREEYSVSSAF